MLCKVISVEYVAVRKTQYSAVEHISFLNDRGNSPVFHWIMLNWKRRKVKITKELLRAADRSIKVNKTKRGMNNRN